MASCCTGKCCCCISLRAGTYIFGICTMVVSVCLLVQECLLEISRLFETEIDFGRAFLEEYGIRHVWVSPVAVIEFTVSGLLLHGVSKDKHRLLVPWMVTEISLILALPVGVAFLLGLEDVKNYSLESWTIPATIAVLVFLTAVKFYSVVVVAAYFTTLRQRNRHRTPLIYHDLQKGTAPLVWVYTDSPPPFEPPFVAQKQWEHIY